MANFRAVSEQDRPEIQAWIDADPGHAGKMTADFFLTPGRFHSLYAIEDEEGPVMHVRSEAEAQKTRMHIQFGPDRKRIVKAFREAYPIVAADVRKRGFLGIVFETSSPALAHFVMKKFNFAATCEVTL